jgi:hypothetical protein
MILIDAKIVFFLMLSSAIYNKRPGIQTFVRGNPIFAPAATLADPPVRRTGLPAHEEGVRKYVVRRMIDN